MSGQTTLSREQVRSLDRRAIEDLGIKGLVLMENAGVACAREAAAMLGDPVGRRVCVVCGRGNNGGDGFVVARHLSNQGADVRVVLTACAEEVLGRGGDAAVNLSLIGKMGLKAAEILEEGRVEDAVSGCADADLIVDALLGTGVSGEVRGVCRPLIGALNALRRPVLGVDLPSGLDCDTGEPLGCAVRCRRTVTFTAFKKGFKNPRAAGYTGKVVVADIGIPRALVGEIQAGGAM